MSDIGPFETSTSFELSYDRPNGPPIEIDIEISGIVYCDDPEWGIEARDVSARVVSRELTDEEIEFLELPDVLSMAFFESEPVSPRIGDYYKCNEDGFIWRVADVCLTWGQRTRSRYVLIERPKMRFDLDLRKLGPERRLVPLDEFAYGVDDEGKSLFEWTSKEEIKEGIFRGPGDA